MKKGKKKLKRKENEEQLKKHEKNKNEKKGKRREPLTPICNCGRRGVTVVREILHVSQNAPFTATTGSGRKGKPRSWCMTMEGITKVKGRDTVLLL